MPRCNTVFWCIVMSIMGFENLGETSIETEPLQNKPEEEIDLSRRNFLKGLGAIALSSLIAQPQESFAGNTTRETSGKENQLVNYENPNEQILSQEYKKGVELFRQKALNEKEEYAGFYVEKEGNGTWQSARHKEGLATINYDSVEEALKGKPNILYIFHTHTTDGIYETDVDRKKDVREGRENPVGMPPSVLDIGTAIDMHDQLLRDYKGTIKIKEKVIDEAGVWTYSFDEKHPCIEEIRELKKFIKKTVSGLSENLSVKAYIDKNPVTKDSDPRIANMDIFDNVSSFDLEAREALSLISKKIGSLGKIIHEVQRNEFMYRALVKERRQPSPQKIADLYKEMGVNLTFEPHEAILLAGK